jgi:hypothetical protein
MHVFERIQSFTVAVGTCTCIAMCLTSTAGTSRIEGKHTLTGRCLNKGTVYFTLHDGNEI